MKKIFFSLLTIYLYSFSLLNAMDSCDKEESRFPSENPDGKLSESARAMREYYKETEGSFSEKRRKHEQQDKELLRGVFNRSGNNLPDEMEAKSVVGAVNNAIEKEGAGYTVQAPEATKK